MADNRVVIAIGGNSLIKDKGRVTVHDQYEAAAETAEHISSLIKGGWDVVISHGNGPQVGFILRRSELASKELHELPLDVCGADSQGAIGYSLQQNLANDLRELGIDRTAATVVTQVQVSKDDPAFQNPTKPIGSFMEEEEAIRRRDNDGWDVREDAGRGWRRVVASPLPERIVEAPAIMALLDAGVVVIAVGGGGIPVVTDQKGDLEGVAAVIDKDFASALLANVVGADTLLISTAVDQVATNWGKDNQEWLDTLTVARAKELLDEGTHFAAGSMAPKIAACVKFIEGGGKKAIVTSPKNIMKAVVGEAGTTIVR